MAVLDSLFQEYDWHDNLFLTDNHFFAAHPSTCIPPSNLEAFKPGFARFMTAELPVNIIVAGLNRWFFVRSLGTDILATGVD
ncbi:hypothetical protein V8E36_003059 [Tilletia maclaganii]